jgi:DNA-binding NtrC family response regulator
MGAPTLLAVGAVEEGHGGESVFNEFPWEMRRAESCLDALVILHRDPPRVLICEQHLPDGTWRDILAMASAVECPPPVIVTSRLADDYLWAEVLNLGGYDVLAKPFDRQEVRRTVTLAWQQWSNRRDAVRRARSGPEEDMELCSTV